MRRAGLTTGLLLAGMAAPQLLAQWSYEVNVDSTDYAIHKSASGAPPPADSVTDPLNPFGGNVGLNVQPPATGTPFMTSAANSSGEAALGVEAIFQDPSTPSPVVRDGSAMAMLSQTVTVPLGPDQTFSYDFSIPTIYLLTADYAGVGAGDPVAPAVSYEIDIQLNGLSIWNSTATLEGGRLARSFTDSGVALVKSAVGDLVNGNEAGYVFSPFSGALSLGTFAGGQSFTVETKLTASLAGGPYELGGLALIGDPANIGSSQFSGSISAVPEPQTYALLGGLGLLGFGVFRRLRR